MYYIASLAIAAAWYGLVGKANGSHVLQCILELDFLSPRATKASGIKNYPSASMSCCSDDLAQYSETIKKQRCQSTVKAKRARREQERVQK